MEHLCRLDFKLLKFPIASETRSWLNILGWEGQDTTRFTSICFVKQEDFCRTKELRTR